MLASDHTRTVSPSSPGSNTLLTSSVAEIKFVSLYTVTIQFYAGLCVNRPVYHCASIICTYHYNIYLNAKVVEHKFPETFPLSIEGLWFVLCIYTEQLKSVCIN